MLSRNYPGRTEENSHPNKSAERCNYTEMLGEFMFWVISRFRREVAENCALLGYYAASGGNILPTFRDSFCILDRSVVPKRR